MADSTLNSLHRADGSATYSHHGYSVVAAVNGPIEVQRRDELPEEAAVDVTIRPAFGVGGVRERHLEAIIQNTLRHVILVSAHPRTLIQITLQIIQSPAEDLSLGGLSQASYSNLPALPTLFQASMLTLLSTNIPMSMTLKTALISVQPDGKLVNDPSPKQLRMATSTHVLAFSFHGDLMVIESEGDFSAEVWEEVHDKAKDVCCGDSDEESDEDTSMDSGDAVKPDGVWQDVVLDKIKKERRWRTNLN